MPKFFRQADRFLTAAFGVLFEAVASETFGVALTKPELMPTALALLTGLAAFVGGKALSKAHLENKASEKQSSALAEITEWLKKLSQEQGGLAKALAAAQDRDLPKSAARAQVNQLRAVFEAGQGRVEEALKKHEELAVYIGKWMEKQGEEFGRKLDELVDLAKKTHEQGRETLELTRDIHETQREHSDRLDEIVDKLPPRPPSRPSVPRQIPPPVQDFTGREKELNVLRAYMGSGAIISGVHGMGGIGKTQLAYKLAQEFAPQYGDGQIYCNLHGADADGRHARTHADAMLHVIRAFDPMFPVPDEDDQLRGQYQSLLRGKKLLLLMDNARDRAQVEPLAPPDGCLLLVTSRRRFTLPGMESVDLDPMPPKEAAKLLLGIWKRIGNTADEIARRCGYLPLALRLAGDALKVHEDVTPQEYITRLAADALAELDEVDRAIAVSESLLTEEARGRFRELAVFPGSFDRPAAAYVLRLEDTPAHRTLSTLVEHSLLDWIDQEQRYRLHDLVRLYADQRLSPVERESLGMLHVEHYLRVAKRTNELYKAGGDDTFKGLRLFDVEFNNIQMGF